MQRMNKNILLSFFVVLVTVRVLKLLDFYRAIRNHERVIASDGEIYYVLQQKDRQAAANILAYVRSGLISLLFELEKQSKGEKVPAKNRPFVARLLRRFPNGQRIHLYEINGKSEKSIAYTKNKTEGFYLCLRDQEGRLHPKEQALFLAIHELTHAGMISFEPEANGRTVHSESFRTYEKFLYTIAGEIGLLDASGLPGRPHCGAYLIAPG